MRKYLKFIIAAFAIAASVGEISAASDYKGDLNGDGKVDLADMVWLAKRINDSSAGSECDLTSDGKVDDNDLHRLANIILSGKLIKNEGLNVGIGGWDEGDEDFGGTVGGTTRSASDVFLSLSSPKYDYSMGTTYKNICVSGADGVVGMLINLQLPNNISIEAESGVRIYDQFANGHAIYGTPSIKEIGEEKYLSMIVFSPGLKNIDTDGNLVQLSYRLESEDSYTAYFKDCQAIGNAEESLHLFSYGPDYTNWLYIPVKSMSIRNGDNDTEIPEEGLKMDVNESVYLYVAFNPADATDQQVEWSSSNENVAIIQDGYLTVVGNGEAVITARSLDGSGKYATCKVTTSSGVEEIFSGTDATADVYDLNSRLILTGATAADLDNLCKGIYILKSKNGTSKYMKK